MNIDLSNPVYWVLLGLILLEYAWELIRYRLSDSMLRKTLPAEVADVYEPEAYSRWLAYRAEGRRLSVVKGAVFTGLTLALFACSVFALVYDGLGLDRLGEWGGVVLMALYTVFCTLVEIPFNYYGTFGIEEKYGFNKSTKKTFWVDFIKSLVLNTVLNVILVAVAASLFRWQGIWVIVWLFALLTLIMIAASAFSMTFMKLNNKFTPLEDGSLKDRLTALFEANGYKVRTIYVMDASRRTTRANAFCTGLGRMKKVALFDNLVNNYTEDEITAVFAHELGHAKHRDTTVLTLMQLLIYAVMAACIGWMVSTDTVSAAMGFDGEGRTTSALVRDQGNNEWAYAVPAEFGPMLDKGRGQRIYGGTVDVGPYEYDLRGDFRRDLSRKLAVTSASTNVVETAAHKVLLTDGQSVAVELAARQTKPLRMIFPFAVTDGTLAIAVNGTVVREATADGEWSYELKPGDEVVFSFAGSGSAELGRAVGDGIVLMVR